MNLIVEEGVVVALAESFVVEKVVFVGIDVVDLVDNFLIDFLPNLDCYSIFDHLVAAHIPFD